MKRRTISVVSSSRADYGLLFHPMRALQDSDAFDLQIVATGTHLSHTHGFTVDHFEKDGFGVDARIEMLLDADTASAIGKSMGIGTILFAEFLTRMRPDMIMFLGDRFEILAAASAGLVAGIPMAHLCGGDVTEGAFDDSVRHAVTKLSHIHFVTNEPARERVIRMGEEPRYVHNVGSPGLDFIRQADIPGRAELASALHIDAERPFLLVTFHPVTRSEASSIIQLDELIGALAELAGGGMQIVFTAPNADNQNRQIKAKIETWVGDCEDAHMFVSLGQSLYLAAMKHAAAIVGNSSSGLYEAPSLGTSTVNIRPRQDGRLRASSVIDCAPEKTAILEAVAEALNRRATTPGNPYGDGHASQRIVDALAAIPDWSTLLRKSFYDAAG